MNSLTFPIVVAMATILSGCDQAQVAEPERVCSQQTSDHPIQVELTSSKKEYLLGEPVLLTVKLTNTGSEVIETYEALIHGTEPEIRVWISGRSLRRYQVGLYPDAKVVRNVEQLKPGQPKTYRLRVLYDSQQASKLAFFEAGQYCIKAEYPLRTPQQPGGGEGRWKSTLLPSNTILITVKKPTGDDAKIWRRINQPSVLRFLQSSQLGEDEEDIPVELADLIERFPKSGYADALKQALRPYYDRLAGGMNASQQKADPWTQRLRRVLAIELKEDPGLFPNDKRLDVKIQYHYPTFTPLQDVYNDLSKQSGVPLHVHPDLRIRRMKGLPQTKPLREFMSAEVYKSKWVKDGDGYKLVPEPAKVETPEK